MDLIVKDQPKAKVEEVSLEPKPVAPVKKIHIPKVSLAEGIREYDKKVQEHKQKVYTGNPYDYNAVALKDKEVDTLPTQQASDMVMDKTYNTIGKLLGVDVLHDWEKEYDKVYKITEWAKEAAGTDDVEEIASWIAEKMRTLPNLGARNIDNLFIFAGIYFNKK